MVDCNELQLIKSFISSICYLIVALIKIKRFSFLPPTLSSVPDLRTPREQFPYRWKNKDISIDASRDLKRKELKCYDSCAFPFKKVNFKKFAWKWHESLCRNQHVIHCLWRDFQTKFMNFSLLCLMLFILIRELRAA